MQKAIPACVGATKSYRLLGQSRRLGVSPTTGKCLVPRRRAQWVAHSTARPTIRETLAICSAPRRAHSAPRVLLHSVHVLHRDYMRKSVSSGLKAYQQNRDANVPDRREALNRTSSDISIQGYFGEFMLADLFAMPIDPLLKPSCRSALTEKGFDGMLRPEMWKVDVKVSKSDTGMLRVQAHKGKNRPDLYALFVYLNFEEGRALDSHDLPDPVLRFDGFIPANAVFDPKYLGKDGKTYWVPTDRLVAREDLWNMVDSGRAMGLRRYAALP